MLRLFRKADLGSRLAALQRQLAAVCPADRRGWLDGEFERLRTEQARPADGDALFPSLETDVEQVSDRKLRICILTADIAGPVRNGGVGSAYAHLASFLAAEGHEVTIAFVHPKGPDNEWVEHYGQDGIQLIHIPAKRGALEPALAAYRWLRTQRGLDLVHVSEWHGLGALAMQAKRLGVAFGETHFAVKASSPTLWNEEGNGQALTNENQLVFAGLERKSAELADSLISGSRHMLRWMESRQYSLNPARCFVQPNVFILPNQRLSDRNFRPEEIVFFGRLEPRKGLLLFCEAIERLMGQGTELPRITFLGGAAKRFDGPEHVSRASSSWPCGAAVRTGLSSREAADYLQSGERLAVIPSLLENSSMAVMECLTHGIPFIACATGGTPELVHPDDHSRVLCAPAPEALAKLLSRALSDGGKSVRPAFDLHRSNEIWRAWHGTLAPRRGRPKDSNPKRNAVLLKSNNVALASEAEDLLRQAFDLSGADIVTSFHHRRTLWKTSDVHCLGDLISGGLSGRGVAGPCCLIAMDVAEALGVNPDRPDFTALYRDALLAGYRLEVIPEVLFTARSWR